MSIVSWLRRSPLLVFAAVVPQLPVFAWMLVTPWLAAAGYAPLWQETPLNPANAIARNDLGQAVRLIRLGHDPNDRYPVAAESSRDPDILMTPLEAAVERGDNDVVKILFELGVVVDDAERRRLVCRAIAREAEDVAEFLAGRTVSAAECVASSQPGGSAP